MIAVDASSLRRFFDGQSGSDIDALVEASSRNAVTVPPVVVTEILSDSSLDPRFVRELLALPMLELREGYWMRTGQLRARMMRSGFKAQVADSLIAQCCIDHDARLITHDRDFRHFVKAGLKLL